MIHDWLVFDDTHQSCKRCGLRLWRARSGGSWNAVTANGVPASFGLLPDGSRLECRPQTNQLPLLVVIDYTGDPDRHPGCERFMHRIRDGFDPASPALTLLEAAPTACGYPAVAWELGPARLHVGWTWCLDCFPERAGARGRVAPPEHVRRAGELEAERQARGELQGLRAKATRKANAEIERIRKQVARELAAKGVTLRYCHCPKCAGGLPSQSETIREIKSVRRKPQGWNPR
jgi:hypothetical protein